MDENMHVYLEQLAREAFKEFDKDNSGTIDQKVGSCILYMTNTPFLSFSGVDCRVTLHGSESHGQRG